MSFQKTLIKKDKDNTMNNYGGFKVKNNQRYVYHSYRQFHPLLCIYDAGIVYPDKNYRYSTDTKYKGHLFEYIVSGKGYIECDGKRYTVREGDCVYISRDCKAVYGSDIEEPYTKLWFSTDGALTPKLCEAMGFFGDVLIVKKNLYDKFQRLLYILENQGFELERMSKHLIGIMLSMFTQEQEQPKADTELSEAAQIKAYIDTVLDSAPTVKSIAKHFGICEATVIRRFKKAYDKTPNDYIREKRLAVAESMLKNTDYSVSAIAQLLNYCSQSYFSEEFHREFGMYPTEYRKKFGVKYIDRKI